MKMRSWVISSIGFGLLFSACPAFATCASLPNLSALQGALESAVGSSNGGLGFNMWATLISNDGVVCAVAFSGAEFTGQWLGSRVISAQKANTANDFSLSSNATPMKSLFPHGLALSTANLYSAVQPGGSLYGLQHSNPVDTAVAYDNSEDVAASGSDFGTSNDPMVGKRIGGVNVFGGGLALYKSGQKVGGLGVSGDTSCTDHMVAWRVRNSLSLDGFGPVAGVSGDPKHPDTIIFDITSNPNGGTGNSAGGFGHPKCLNNPDPTTLPPVH
jgi:hypothetical protein